ncbi:MAG: peptidoglycan DD-metalloendopeptidase family protein [Pseudomonadota bacterium]
MRRLAVLVSLCVASGAQAQSTQSGAALAQSTFAGDTAPPAQALSAATAMLNRATHAQQRVEALTHTIKVLENGLAGMRDGLRRAALQEAQVRARLETQEAEVAELLAVLFAMDGARAPVAFLHPNGPLGTARSGMLLAEMTPALNTKAQQLRTDLERLADLRRQQQDAALEVQSALQAVQNARTKLNQAMANRTDLPQRFTADPVRMGILIASAETLAAFASGLRETVAEEHMSFAIPVVDQLRRAQLPLPVKSVLLRAAGTPDAAGIVRPGILLASYPGALVTAPTTATIRYAGPLLDFGNVVILEPRHDTLFIFAGLGVAYGQPGQIVGAGTPVGLMGGTAAAEGEELSPLREGAGRARSETLYIEVRQNNQTHDPAEWFRTGEDG